MSLIAGSAAVILLVQPDTAGVIIIGSRGCHALCRRRQVSHSCYWLSSASCVIAARRRLRIRMCAQRLETYFNQSADPQGAGYQVQQSLIAVGSGGVDGAGFGQRIEKFSYLPEPIGDSIFAVAGEEFGFIGSVCWCCSL